MSQNFGKIASGEEATLYTLKAGNIQLDVTDFGAAWVNLIFDGTDILQGYDDAGQYERSTNYFGATVGRVANRIEGASFSLNGKTCQLETNEGTNSLHGGFHGYDKRIWQTSGVSDDGRQITFTLHSPSGDQGYPGSLELSVTFEVTEDDEILTTYSARSDQDTLCNPTNHSFFNLNGAGGADIENHVLRIDADAYLEIDDKMLPKGEPASVKGTLFDFRTSKSIGQDIMATTHSYTSREAMTMPVLQLYTGNMMDKQAGKNVGTYGRRSGLALETQFFPDSIHHHDYPSVILTYGEEKKYLTRYTFSRSTH